jgi:hypothetical protein
MMHKATKWRFEDALFIHKPEFRAVSISSLHLSAFELGIP